MNKEAIKLINELEQKDGKIFIALEFPEYQDYIGDEGNVYPEDSGFLLVPITNYIKRKYGTE